MKRLLKMIMMAAILPVLLMSCRTTQYIDRDNSWVLLGEAKANHLREKDIIKVKSRDFFSDVKIFVYDRDVEIDNFEITLANGDILKPVMDTQITSGSVSRIVELSVEGKQIEQLMIRYRSRGKLFSKKARVEFGARRANYRY